MDNTYMSKETQEKRFQELCSNEQDVKEFLELLELFNIFENENKISIVTDLGYTTTEIVERLYSCTTGRNY